MTNNNNNRKIVQVLEAYPYKVLLHESYDTNFRMPSRREVKIIGGADAVNANIEYDGHYHRGISSRKELEDLIRKFANAGRMPR